MKGKYKHVIAGFHKKLEGIGSGERLSLKKANKGIHLCNNALYVLKGIVEDKGFRDIEEEIYFFKKVKAIAETSAMKDVLTRTDTGD